jgi:hypothetical protein
MGLLPGLALREPMSGSYFLLRAPTEEHALSASVEIHTDDLTEALREKAFRVGGTIDAEGLATARPLTGSVAWSLLHQGRLVYRLAFQGDDGKRYEMTGQKEWSGLSPIHSLTLLPASLYDEDAEEIGRGTLRFDLRADGVDFLKSFRLHFGRGPGF